MRYIVDLNSGHSNKINKLLQDRRYESVSQFISVAIENQLYLEESEINEKAQVSNNRIIINERQHDNSGYPQDSISLNIPIENSNPEIVDRPKVSDLSLFPSSEIEDCWLWGQINRIFPIKLGLRILLSKLKNNRWMDLNEFRDEAALIASKYRQMIDNIDEPNINTRETGAGLPIYFTNNVDKLKVENSMNRYKNQFLAYVRTDQKLDGALTQLKFSHIKPLDEDKYLIGITEEGLTFAQLNNPIIDEKDLHNTLNREEINFYINHIKEHHIGEYKGVIWLLEKLNNNISDRTKLNEELKKDYNQKWDLNDQVINTQRAGLTARMTELGLIDKKKRGVKVKYLISEYGKNILKNK